MKPQPHHLQQSENSQRGTRTRQVQLDGWRTSEQCCSPRRPSWSWPRGRRMRQSWPRGRRRRQSWPAPAAAAGAATGRAGPQGPQTSSLQQVSALAHPLPGKRLPGMGTQARVPDRPAPPSAPQLRWRCHWICGRMRMALADGQGAVDPDRRQASSPSASRRWWSPLPAGLQRPPAQPQEPRSATARAGTVAAPATRWRGS
mmetsp:Transcript_41942/g.121356  ORF Transcript_41942/g.121356 Transcript_41942/m.121356 type:complete len:201 (+) Transcript_41942:1064-1666(+)